MAAHPKLLDSSDVLGFRALRVLDDLELHGLTLGQSLESVTLNGRKMNEYVWSTFLLDEAEAFFLVKPLYSSTRHVWFTSSGMLLGDYCLIGNSLWREKR